MMAMNPYIDMPLPVNVRIEFDLFARTESLTSDNLVRRCRETEEAVREVVRALNALAYAEGS